MKTHKYDILKNTTKIRPFSHYTQTGLKWSVNLTGEKIAYIL